jgi:hypothetical protein
MSSRWTTPGEIAARVRRRWDDGSLLRLYADGAPFAPIEIPLRGPKPSEIGDDIAAARSWVADLDAGRRGDTRYALLWAGVGGRSIGRNEIPSRAVVACFEQAWTLLGVAATVRRYDELLAQVADYPSARDWVVGHPLRALELHDEMPRMTAAYAWLDAHRQSGRYLREITAPGVDTKFAEQHRVVLAGMLGVPAAAPGFLAALGLRSKPEFVRLRPAPSLGLPSSLTEFSVRAQELAELVLEPSAAIVIENEISYLSVDVPTDGVVIWGRGFDVDRVGRLPWLAGADVVYWGDIDTHGFAILDRFRAWHPHTRSVLMDRVTLMAHRDRWVTEDRPAAAALTRLTPPEGDLYDDLVADRLGHQLRLEQERIDWTWVQQHLRT